MDVGADMRTLTGSFVEQRNARGLINRDAHFAGFMAELLVTFSSADAFVGTSTSTMSRLYLLAVAAGGDGTEIRAPNVEFIDRPLRGLFEMLSNEPMIYQMPLEGTAGGDAYPLENGGTCACACHWRQSCDCLWTDTQAACYRLYNPDVAEYSQKASCAGADCIRRAAHCHYTQFGVREGRRTCSASAPSQLASGTVLQSWLLQKQGLHVACIGDAWLQTRFRLTPRELWRLDRNCATVRWDADAARARLWADLAGSDCNPRKQLSLTAHSAGWFATLHGLVKPLMHAALTRKTLLPPRAEFYVPHDCDNGTLSCLFLPTSRCAPSEQALMLTAAARPLLGRPNSWLHAHSGQQLLEKGAIPNEGWFWWASALFEYATRPNTRLQSQLYAAMRVSGLRSVLQAGEEVVLGLHVRRGDSCITSEERITKRRCEPLSAYMDGVVRLADSMPVRTIYISTDSLEVLNQTKNWPQFRFLHFKQVRRAARNRPPSRSCCVSYCAASVAHAGRHTALLRWSMRALRSNLRPCVDAMLMITHACAHIQAVAASSGGPEREVRHQNERWDQTIRRRSSKQNLRLAKLLTIDVMLLSRCHLLVGVRAMLERQPCTPTHSYAARECTLVDASLARCAICRREAHEQLLPRRSRAKCRPDWPRRAIPLTRLPLVFRLGHRRGEELRTRTTRQPLPLLSARSATLAADTTSLVTCSGRRCARKPR